MATSRTPIPWSRRERGVIEQRYTTASWTELRALLPGRTDEQIAAYAKHRKLRRHAPRRDQMAQAKRADFARNYLAARAAAITSCCDQMRQTASICLGLAACHLIAQCCAGSEPNEAQR
ncbi:hypothetical protein DYI24_12825 [Rhodopseudomonas sp. BR0C11]|uniref:hypothetical protein n=1 Tax=Rhodopseudomonas sp. BR0C11 TaxID=2269370 RepID=UPI0013DEFBF2|nr:hypothetical protein [Rhodopseudomonas sp. BR0C11]NEV77921.1 hypothetical protein [Rhodopseudomonas sp. BR0C11]